MDSLSEFAIEDIDRDSVHILPLATVPLLTTGLSKTRMIKNTNLESVVEVFEGEGTGSGYVPVESLTRVFRDVVAEDMVILKHLSKLYSYDVFGLRIQLRNLGIEVNNHEALKLSDSKQAELSEYMKQFTQRLIVEIFGSDDDDVKSYDDILALFKHPDVNLALSKLKKMAEQLGISVDDVPRFLEDYGDIYLSVAYYRECMDSIQPAITDFDQTIDQILQHNQLKHDAQLGSTCKRLQKKVQNLNTVVGERFKIFSQCTEEMWENINESSFQEFKQLVEDNYAAIGAILCTLSVKMDSWFEKFPNRQSGGPVKRAEFILSDIRQGL